MKLIKDTGALNTAKNVLGNYTKIIIPLILLYILRANHNKKGTMTRCGNQIHYFLLFSLKILLQKFLALSRPLPFLTDQITTLQNKILSGNKETAALPSSYFQKTWFS